MLNTAIQLKQAIDKIPKIFSPIGYSPINDYDSDEEKEDSDDENFNYDPVNEYVSNNSNNNIVQVPKDLPTDPLPPVFPNQIHFPYVSLPVNTSSNDNIDNKYYDDIDTSDKPDNNDIGSSDTPGTSGDESNYRTPRDSDERSEKPINHSKINKRLKELVDTEREAIKCDYIDIKDKIIVNGHSAPLSFSTLKSMFENAPLASYGDMKNLTTVINPEVRSARDITNFIIGDELLRKLEEMWTNNFGESVTIKPYKVNLYGLGDHFKSHKDTSEKDLIGTILICLNTLADHTDTLKNERIEEQDKQERKGGSFKVVDKYDKMEHCWDFETDTTNVYMFYSDCIHEVTKLESDWIRATLALKVFSDKDTLSISNKNIETLLSGISTPFGIILDHEYSLGGTTLKGRDNNIISALNNINKKYEIIDIINKIYYSFQPTDGRDEDKEYYSHIYLLNDEIISYTLNLESKKPEIKYNDIVFYKLSDGFEWSKEEDQGALYTGNEARPGCIDSIYISRAIIISE